MRGAEHGFVGVGRPDAVAPLHLVGVGARLARQHARVGAQADDLVAQPAVLELVAQRLGGGDQRAWVDRRLRLDGRRQLRRAEVGIDDPVDVPAELQPQHRRSAQRRTGSRGERNESVRLAMSFGLRSV